MSRLVNHYRTAGVLAVAAILAACGADPVSSVPTTTSVSANFVTNNTKTMTLCKTGPVGTYSFNLERSGNTTNKGDVFLSGIAGLTGSVTLTVTAQTPTPCTIVYSRTQADNEFLDPVVNVLITELAAPGTTLDDIISSSEAGPTTENIAGRSVSMPLNAFHNAIATFVNKAVVIEPPPVERGCTYTQGWYKNKGKATITGKTLNGVSYLDVLNTPPKGGNVYYILAHQYIAASENRKVASGTPAVDAALAAAVTYFSVATPTNSVPAGYTKEQITAWANTLDDYNNGRTGPGHCDSK